MQSPIDIIYPFWQSSIAANGTSKSPKETRHFSRSENPSRVPVVEAPRMSSIDVDLASKPLLPAGIISDRSIILFSFFGLSGLIGLYFLWRRWLSPIKVDPTGNEQKIRNLRRLRTQNQTASVLSDMVEEDGAGAWPPKANHDSWPSVLRPYQDIYLELAPLLPAAEPSLDDDVNNVRRESYRALMRRLLEERVDIAAVEKIVADIDAGKSGIMSNAEYNGFYACIAVCRHAYR